MRSKIQIKKDLGTKRGTSAKGDYCIHSLLVSWTEQTFTGEEIEHSAVVTANKELNTERIAQAITAKEHIPATLIFAATDYNNSFYNRTKIWLPSHFAR